ncbi:WD repeat-containing protein 19 [Coelomomyces lativittatus]|nr:WD repeat-containing protein 19 [Coelomomyces lativittatus]
MSINLTHLAIGFQHEVQIYTLNPLKQTLVIPCNNGIQQLCMSAQVVCVLTGQNLKSYSFTENDTVGTHIENVTLIGYYDAFVVTVFGDTVTYYTAPYNSTSIHASIPLKLPITQWFQSPICASAILISESQCFLCNPARDHVFPIPCKALNFLWDAFHPNLFYAYTSDTLFCFAYLPYTLTGAPTVQLVCQINLPLGWIPLYATEGQATCIFEQKVHVFPLFDAQNLSHLYYLNLHTTLFQKLLATSMQKESTSEMIEEALKALDLSFVRDAFMFSGDLANAAYFKLCAYDEELNIRRGHVLKWYQDFSGAQEMYLNSSQPIYALHLRKDLLQWEQALALASKMAVDEEPKVCEAYAKQLESDGRYSDALIMYQKALGINTHLPTSKNGVAKMKLRMGDFKVVQWIIDQDEPQVCLESAIILEELKEYMNAGMLYEKGKDFEKAAENFLLAQNWSKLDNLLPQVKNLKIYNTYGQYLESQKLFDKALRCYEKGNNALGMTKVYLAMSRIDEALKVARESKSQDAAKLVAQFLVQLGDLNTVLEFYLLAGLHQQAWQLAKEHNLVQQYIDFLGTSASKDQFLEAAVYYETTSPLLAGQYYLRAEAYETALSRFLNHPEGIEGAIETVGKAKKDHLTHALINYLMELKGAEKPRYIFQLYMKLGQFREAMRTALGIARDEWNIGNYRSARDILFETLIQLRNAKQRVSGQLIRMLFLLHSYMLVKPLIKLEEHNNCARMLSRVSKSISRFQTHVIPILTSTVIECSKAGLLHIAYEFSVQLMRPEYRSQIDVKYKKRIENIVRNHVESETPNFEPTSPCPHCQSPLPNTETECNQCQNTIPFCIASGYHMTIENWSQCPNCLFPALLPSLRKFSEAGLGCPLCGEVIPLEKLKLVDNPQLSLSSWKYDEDTTEPSQQPTTALTKDAKG